MPPFKRSFALFILLALLLGTLNTGVTEVNPIPPGVTFEGIIDTANCNIAGGLCQGGTSCNGGAGPNPDNIQASVTLCENAGTLTAEGGTLTGSGTGTGFRFGKTYISLIYVNGNTATCSRFPNGVVPLLENLDRADHDFASMMLGFWVVKPDGSATLTVAKQAPISGLRNYGSISVREIQPPNLTCFDSDRDPAPQINALRACGPLRRTGFDCWP